MNLKDLPVVTDSNIFDKQDRFTDGGLFSEVIFGPIHDYTCKCGITKLPMSEDTNEYERCSICGVKYAPSSLRAEQHAIIKLPFQIPSIHIVKLLRHNRKLKERFEELREDAIDLLYEEIEKYKTEGKFVSKSKQIIQKVVQHDELLYKEEILVIPPDLRPISSNGKKNFIISEINHYYLRFLEQIDAYYTELETGSVNENYHKNVILKIYLELYQFILNMGVKEGDIRQRILAKRIDFSGRTVNSVDHTLKMDQIRVPYKILVKLWEPLILYYYDGNKFQAYHDIKQFVNQGELTDLLKNTIDYIATKVPLALNRQPTLHRGSLRAYWVIPWENDTIAVNPYMTALFNLDFDGDSIKGRVKLKIIEKETGNSYIMTKEITDIKKDCCYKSTEEQIDGSKK